MLHYCNKIHCWDISFLNCFHLLRQKLELIKLNTRLSPSSVITEEESFYCLPLFSTMFFRTLVPWQLLEKEILQRRSLGRQSSMVCSQPCPCCHIERRAVGEARDSVFFCSSFSFPVMGSVFYEILYLFLKLFYLKSFLRWINYLIHQKFDILWHPQILLKSFLNIFVIGVRY